jgi:hypothetical protein
LFPTTSAPVIGAPTTYPEYTIEPQTVPTTPPTTENLTPEYLKNLQTVITDLQQPYFIGAEELLNEPANWPYACSYEVNQLDHTVTDLDRAESTSPSNPTQEESRQNDINGLVSEINTELGQLQTCIQQPR